MNNYEMDVHRLRNELNLEQNKANRALTEYNNSLARMQQIDSQIKELQQIMYNRQNQANIPAYQNQPLQPPQNPQSDIFSHIISGAAKTFQMPEKEVQQILQTEEGREILEGAGNAFGQHIKKKLGEVIEERKK